MRPTSLKTRHSPTVTAGFMDSDTYARSLKAVSSRGHIFREFLLMIISCKILHKSRDMKKEAFCLIIRTRWLVPSLVSKGKHLDCLLRFRKKEILIYEMKQ